MAMTTTRSTAAQRASLRLTRAGLSEALATVGNRYFLSETQRAAYGVVARHLEFWTEYESEEWQ